MNEYERHFETLTQLLPTGRHRTVIHRLGAGDWWLIVQKRPGNQISLTSVRDMSQSPQRADVGLEYFEQEITCLVEADNRQGQAKPVYYREYYRLDHIEERDEYATALGVVPGVRVSPLMQYGLDTIVSAWLQLIEQGAFFQRLKKGEEPKNRHTRNLELGGLTLQLMGEDHSRGTLSRDGESTMNLRLPEDLDTLEALVERAREMTQQLQHEPGQEKTAEQKLPTR